MGYQWPAKDGYPQDFTYLGPSLSFLKNPILRYALLKRLEYGLDLSLADLTQDSLVLEVGAGAGFFFPEVAKRAHSIIDLDYHPEMYFPAVRKMLHSEKIDHKVSLIAGDIHRLPFKDESFDLVYCFSVLEHASLVGVQELHRVLKSSGLLIAGIPIETIFSTVGRVVLGIGGHKKGEVFHSHQAMEDEIKRFFTVEQYRRVPHNITPDFFALYDVLRCLKK